MIDPAEMRRLWTFEEGAAYLNHGSFGPAPEPVRREQERWRALLNRQPMDFFVRRYAEALEEARGKLGEFLGAEAGDLAFVDNATTGMNVVASTVRLQAGDEVLLTDHEYGAVRRIWRRACDEAGAKLVEAKLPQPLQGDEEIVAAVAAAITERTRVLVVSHITSSTAVILPAARLCQLARERDVLSCVDGPHAVAQLPVDLGEIGCDFYAASCHKWLCAPFGSGFLFATEQARAGLRPPVLSWGRVWAEPIGEWGDELHWLGTRDPSAWLATPAAIDFLAGVGWREFREHGKRLADLARRRLLEIAGTEPLAADERCGFMALAPLPEKVQPVPLRERLWSQHRLEAPVFEWQGRAYLRASFHLYNSAAEVDRLCAAVKALL